ncbi:MAG: response regulator transcription factor [Acidobacteriota bacterium]
MSRILVVEDEQHIAQGLCFNLEADGHEVEISPDGETAMRRLSGERGAFDAVVLDVMLPGRDGFDVAAALRRQGDFVPILMLTAQGRPEDVLRGFESGADDYLSKPFELAILLARLRGLLRRSAWAQSPRSVLNGESPGGGGTAESGATSPAERSRISFGGHTLDLAALELRVDDRSYHLTVMEADLLHYLLGNAGKVVSRKAILEDVWNLHEDTDTRAIDNFVVRLRRYLKEDAAKPRHVLTVRGVGYKFIADP